MARKSKDEQDEKPKDEKKTPAKRNPVRIQHLLASELFQKLKKKHGDLILTSASDARVAKAFRIPSGVFQVDKALCGGWPQGRVNVIYGMKSSCKTTLLFKTIAEAQHQCSNCWEYVHWAKLVEVEVEDAEVIDETTGEVTVIPSKKRGKKAKAEKEEAEPEPKEKKTKKEWVSAPVARWYAHGDKWKELLRVETQPDPEDEHATIRVPILGEEIKPTCGCRKYREAVCAFIDVEGTFDKKWALRQGIDLDKLLLSVPEYAEQSLDIGDALVRSGDCDVIVLDSIAFLTPAKEIEESTEKETMGGNAKIVNRGVRKFVSGLNMAGLHSERRPTVFLTNQIRMKIGVMFGNPEVQPGGMAPGFAASVELKMKPGVWEFDKTDEDHPIPLEVEFPFHIEKSKAGGAKRTDTFKMAMVDGTTKLIGDVLDEEFVMAEAQALGLIVKESSHWTCLGTRYDSKGLIDKRMRADKEFYRLVKQTCLKLVNEPVEDLGLQPVPEPLPETPATEVA